MLMIFRVLSGAVGLSLLAGTVALALRLLAMEPDPKVLLAGYMGIGCIMLGVYMLVFAVTGDLRSGRRAGRNEKRPH